MSELVTAVIAVALACYGLARIGRLAAASWVLVRAWRWLSGAAHHGHPVTDAGWLRHGQRALTTTGHATRWWHLPRLQRAAWRTGGTLAVVVAVWGWLAARTATLIVVGLLALGAAGLLGVAGVRWARERRDRRTWLYPLHLAAHQLAGHPRAIPASSWISIDTDPKTRAVTAARIRVAQGWPADAKDQQRLAAIAGERLGIEAPEVRKQLAGPAPVITLTRSEPPPRLVTYADVADAVTRAGPDELICGLGKQGAVVKASLALDSPHFGINMGSGGGKSVLAAFWLAQLLRRGWIAMVLDPKWVSQPWLIKDEDGEYQQLPNAAYLSSAADLHEGMVWLGGELERRTRVAQRAVTASGKVRGDVGAPLVIVAEELNLAAPLLRQYWSDIRDNDQPKKSPALSGLGAVAFAGRAMRMHLCLIGQMLTAEVTGSKDNSVKANVGVWAMGRYQPSGWRTSVGDIPMPPSSNIPGRIQLVNGGSVRETQAPLIDMAEMRELAMSGVVTPCPAGMPGAVTAAPPALPAGPDLRPVTVTAPSAQQLVTLRQAVEQGLLRPRTTIGALRAARHRDSSFPASAGKDGLADLYNPRELAEWDWGRS